LIDVLITVKTGDYKFMIRPKKKSVAKKDFTNVDYIDLVDIVRKSRSRERSNEAYSEIERRMKYKLKQITFKFFIPGMGNDDIYQEALYALRYKAIKDYDKTRGSGDEPYPFDRFAILCIRRHLATSLKSSYQNKTRVLNQSISLDQERRDSSSTQDFMFLSDILPISDIDVLEDIELREYYKILFSTLYKKLSDFEKMVFVFYSQRYSYEQIAEKINRKRNKIGLEKINVKSIDNSLSRIKMKSKKISVALLKK